MNLAGAALGREFLTRHRWGFAAIAAYVVALAAWMQFSAAPMIATVTPGELPDLSLHFIFTILVPTTCVAFYFVAVFSFGLSGDISARESMYPRRLFTLPLPSSALAAWPMIYGSAAMALLWLAVFVVGIRPSGVAAPALWPALFLPAVVAWMQAITWQSYPLPGMRLIVAVVWLAVIDATVLLSLHFQASQTFMVALLAPQLPLAYLVARNGVARARRGDIAAWGTGAATSRPVEERRFESPTQAQGWYEWQRHGRVLPVWVAILLTMELALLFLDDTPTIVFRLLVAAVLTPPVMAVFVAPALASTSSDARDAFGLAAFDATRPMTSAALVGARLRMALQSTLAAWGVAALMIPAALLLSGRWSLVAEKLSETIAYVGGLRAGVIALLLAVFLVATTWRALVGSLYIGMSGRRWLIRGSPLIALVLIIALGMTADWVLGSGRAQKVIWEGFFITLFALASIKAGASIAAFRRLHQQRLVADQRLLLLAAVWCAAVLLVYGTLAWLAETPLIPRSVLMFMAILAIPLARPALAPSALARNRHR